MFESDRYDLVIGARPINNIIPSFFLQGREWKMTLKMLINQLETQHFNLGVLFTPFQNNIKNII